MSRYWNPDVAQLSPYVPGEQPKSEGLIKLNTNELPQGPSPDVLQALREACDSRLRLYPDPDNSALREAWGSACGVAAERVFLGNGSDEVLAHTFRALFQPEAPLLYPDITYSFYPVYSNFFGLEAQVIPLDEGFGINLEDYRRDNGGIIFPNPNAPTGISLPLGAIEGLLQDNTDSVVVVDEAYVDFGAESACALIDRYPNLLVIQTLSKSRALAGLRVGAALGQEALIEGLMRVKNSFNSYPLDRLAEVGAIAALEDRDWFEQATAEIIRCREQLTTELEGLGFEVLPSMANFVFARHSEHRAVELHAALREHNILVRHFRQQRIEDFLRISIGTEAECATLVAALKGILVAA